MDKEELKKKYGDIDFSPLEDLVKRGEILFSFSPRSGFLLSMEGYTILKQDVLFDLISFCRVISKSIKQDALEVWLSSPIENKPEISVQYSDKFIFQASGAFNGKWEKKVFTTSSMREAFLQFIEEI